MIVALAIPNPIDVVTGPIQDAGESVVRRAFDGVFDMVATAVRTVTDALIEAYRYYRSMHPAPSRISFDRAFDLVAHSTGLWFARCASFCTSWCPHCHAEYLGALGGRSTAPSACPFCQILRRYDRDPRLTTDYLPPPPPDDQVFSAWGLVGSTGYGATPAC